LNPSAAEIANSNSRYEQ